MTFIPFKDPKKKSAHGIAAINYLLNFRVEEGMARVLKGDEKLTRSIVNSITNQQKLSVGCLSFEEENIDEKLKYKLMAEFEEMLLPDMKDRVNVLWVEHRDKGRLELNYVIPKIDLVTGKSLNPYYFLQDQKRVDLWKNLQNLKYGFSDPNDPAKKRNVEMDKKTFREIKDYENLDQILQKIVVEKKIQNRIELISFCEEMGIEVTRKKNKNYLSLKLPGKKAHRFSHTIYTSRFTSLDMLETFEKEKENEIDEYEKVDIRAEIEKKEKEVQKFIDWKRAQLQKDFMIGVEEPKIEKNKRHKNNNTSSYQNKLFYDNYNHHATADLLGFYIDLRNKKSINVLNRRKNINIKDGGGKITSTSRKRGIQNVQERVRIMLDIAMAKGWNLYNLNIKGGPEFLKEVQNQVIKLKSEEKINVIYRGSNQERNRTGNRRYSRDFNWRGKKTYKSTLDETGFSGKNGRSCMLSM